MRAVPARRRRRARFVPVLAVAAALLPLELTAESGLSPGAFTAHAATATVLSANLAAKSSASATAKRRPGTGASQACFSSIAYTINGRTRPSRPLPAVTSRVGGDRLAAPGLQVSAQASAAPPAPKATAWLVADVDTGRVLAACNAHVPLAPASSLKVLTALSFMHQIDADTRYVARAEDANVDGTRVGLVPGSVYTAGDLWHALLMGSANDAATALAELAGGTTTAAKAMEEKARSLGAADTRVRNTSGLDEAGQVSSAYDLALFGRAALSDPEVMRYSQTRSYPFPEAGKEIKGSTRKTFQIQNHDKLLYNYPGALGIKNGWTSTTGGSFIGAAQRGGRRIVVTVLAADPQTWQMSAALLDWAFTATGPDAEGVGELVTGPVPSGASGSASGAAGSPDGAHGVFSATGANPSRSEPGGPMLAVIAATLAVLGAVGVGGRRLQLVQRRRSGSELPVDDPWRRRRSH